MWSMLQPLKLGHFSLSFGSRNFYINSGLQAVCFMIAKNCPLAKNSKSHHCIATGAWMKWCDLARYRWTKQYTRFYLHPTLLLELFYLYQPREFYIELQQKQWDLLQNCRMITSVLAIITPQLIDCIDSYTFASGLTVGPRKAELNRESSLPK